jgi:hypothetical protein
MCFTCSSQYYNPDESKTAEKNQVYNSKKVLSYGSVTLFGQEYSDTVSLEPTLDNNSDVDHFEFFMAIETIGKNNFDGILGINPGHAGADNSYIRALKK